MKLEPNNIYLGDCMDLLCGIPDKSVDLVITDPPYLHTKGRGINRKTGKAYADGHSKFANSELFSTSGFMMAQMSTFGEDEMRRVIGEYLRVLKKPNMYVFCNETQVPHYANIANERGLMFSILVWEKPLSIINRNRFSQNVEFIVRLYDYGTALNKIDGLNDIYGRVRRCNQVSPHEKVHPTQKPVTLVESYIMLSTNAGDVVLDSFMGSGTTCIACLKQGRRYIGIEKDASFFKVAKQRIENYNAQLKLF